LRVGEKVSGGGGGMGQSVVSVPHTAAAAAHGGGVEDDERANGEGAVPCRAACESVAERKRGRRGGPGRPEEKTEDGSSWVIN
jgi:hypothetical protein